MEEEVAGRAYGHRVQRAASSSMLLEEGLGTVTRRFFLVYEDRLVDVSMTLEMRSHVR